ncbi:hypothetical protein BRADI_4g31470v3 [Brachypodium distachyon]|uniref:Uncharacterized protein n=1 Tax=Brachypodium distachyon TaxID=15368 RepID=A0A0Q3ESC2_BRADI|nr:hypothetical protein BRADI_4g31470v3 [Brachypodium distachyon]KQJ90433.1 hypothetical protein BRADI_4g31470v3 [Brachypodium distachyon]
MASSSPPPPTAGARPNPTSSSFSTACPGYHIWLCSAYSFRAFAVSFQQRQACPLTGCSRPSSPIRCSQGSGEVDAVNIEEAKQAQGASTGPRYYDKDLLPSFSPKELLEKLKRYGAAGVLSYGLLNTVYYVTTFLLVWFHLSPAPGRMGYAAAVERFIKLMAMVWAGSQVTKVLRAGGITRKLHARNSK